MADLCDVIDIALINFGEPSPKFINALSVNNNISDLSSPSSQSVKVIDPFLVSAFTLYPLHRRRDSKCNNYHIL